MNTPVTPCQSIYVQLPDGYSRLKQRPLLTFRHPVDVAELVEHCSTHKVIWFRASDGTAKRCTVIGKVKTWVTRPGDCHIPVKFGMYEYSFFDASGMALVLIPVEDTSCI